MERSKRERLFSSSSYFPIQIQRVHSLYEKYKICKLTYCKALAFDDRSEARLDLMSLRTLKRDCSDAIGRLEALYGHAESISRLETSLEEACILMYFMEIVSLSITVFKGSRSRIYVATVARRIRKLQERIWKASLPDVIPGTGNTLKKAQGYATMFQRSAEDFDAIMEDALALETEYDAEGRALGRHCTALRQAISLVTELASTRRWLNRVMSSMFSERANRSSHEDGDCGHDIHHKAKDTSPTSSLEGNLNGFVHAGTIADACLQVWNRCHANGGAILHSAEDLRHEIRSLDLMMGQGLVSQRVSDETSERSASRRGSASEKIVAIVRECLQLKHKYGHTI